MINESKNIYPSRNDYVVCNHFIKELNDFLKISAGCIIDWRHDDQGRKRFLVVYDDIPEELLKYFYHSFSGYFHYFYKSNILKCSEDRKKFQDIGYNNIFGLEREKFRIRKEEEKRKKIEMMKNVDPYNEEVWDDLYEMRISKFTPPGHIIKEINTLDVIRQINLRRPKNGFELWRRFASYLNRKLIGKVCSFPVLGKDKDGKLEIHGANHWKIVKIYLDENQKVHMVADNGYDVMLAIGESLTDYIYYEDAPDEILPWDPYNEEEWDEYNEANQYPTPKFKVDDLVYFRGRKPDERDPNNYRNTLWSVRNVITYDNSPHDFLRGSKPMYSCIPIKSYGKMTGFSKSEDNLSHEPFEDISHSIIDPYSEEIWDDEYESMITSFHVFRNL